MISIPRKLKLLLTWIGPLLFWSIFVFKISHEESTQFRLVHKQGGPTKVLLVTYMRGGSTFLGELFNQNKQALYWYEPLEGIYHALYGFLPMLQPLDILYHKNRTRRSLPLAEREYIYGSLQKLFAGNNLSSLPPELLYSRVILDRHVKWNKALQKCLKPKFKSKMNWVLMFKRRNCNAALPEPELQQIVKCSVQNNIKKSHEMVQKTLEKQCEKVNLHKQCMQLVQKWIEPCNKKIDVLTANKSINAVKVIRMSNELVLDILNKDPTIKVIYYTRDPRGIIASRKHAGKWIRSKNAAGKWAKEAKILCERILQDYHYYTLIKASYPNNIIMLKYEDLAQDPLQIANQIYSFLGKHLPQDVEIWLKNNTQATKDAGDFETSRKNSTATAFAWKSKLEDQLLNYINKHCKNALNTLGYR